MSVASLAYALTTEAVDTRGSMTREDRAVLKAHSMRPGNISDLKRRAPEGVATGSALAGVRPGETPMTRRVTGAARYKTREAFEDAQRKQKAKKQTKRRALNAATKVPLPPRRRRKKQVWTPLPDPLDRVLKLLALAEIEISVVDNKPKLARDLGRFRHVGIRSVSMTRAFIS